MLDEYLLAIERHWHECLEDLNSLSDIALQRPFNRIERRAVERSLQVLIESCIGVAKHWLKTVGKTQPLDAYENFNKLAELQFISLVELKQWRKIIGMRNALVHDYLTIDSELLQQLLAEKHYLFLIQFLKKACQQLRNNY